MCAAGLALGSQGQGRPSRAATLLALAGTETPAYELRHSQPAEPDQRCNDQYAQGADSSGLFRFSSGLGFGTLPLGEQLGRNRIFVHWALQLNTLFSAARL